MWEQQPCFSATTSFTSVRFPSPGVRLGGNVGVNVKDTIEIIFGAGPAIVISRTKTCAVYHEEVKGAGACGTGFEPIAQEVEEARSASRGEKESEDTFENSSVSRNGSSLPEQVLLTVHRTDGPVVTSI